MQGCDCSEARSNPSLRYLWGKITSITKTSDTNITYSYDAAGNRISKTVSPASGATVTTWYVRDASGNVMAVYYNTDSLRMTEQHIYGSSRLGILNTSINVQRVPVANTIIFNYRGFRNYELANHLGNVPVTITDKKMGVPSAGNSSLIDHFNADVASANDYYPFGMLMPGRGLSAANAYRYGFNGKEKSDEVNGSGVDYDYGFRIYDARAGRFLSEDPLTKKYPWYTPFQFAGNKPIWAVDLHGKEEKIVVTQLENGKQLSTQTFTAKDAQFKSIVNNLPKDLKNVKPGVGTLEIDMQKFSGIMHLGDPNYNEYRYKGIKSNSSTTSSATVYTNRFAAWAINSSYSPENWKLENWGVKSVGAGFDVNASDKILGKNIKTKLNANGSYDGKVTYSKKILNNRGSNDMVNTSVSVSSELNGSIGSTKKESTPC